MKKTRSIKATALHMQTQDALGRYQQYDNLAQGGCHVWISDIAPQEVLVQHRFDNYKSWAKADSATRLAGLRKLVKYRQVLRRAGFTCYYTAGRLVPALVVTAAPPQQETFAA